MKRAFLLALFLVGCNQPGKPDPQIIYVPTEVKVPVKVPCPELTPPKPAYPMDTVAADANIYAQMQAVLADWVLRQTRERALEEALARCQATPEN